MTLTIDRPEVSTGLDPLYTLEELAEYTKTSMSTLYSLRSAGKGPTGFRLGRSLRFRSSDVDAWIASMASKDGAAK